MDTKLEKIRHTASHVLAQAALELFPDVKLAIGPAIEEGFYYDFDLGGKKTFSEDDLKKLEKRMREIIKQDQKMEHYTRDAAESIKYIKSKNQPYKLEMAQELMAQGEQELSFYTMVGHNGKRQFTDLCKGPHVRSTKEIGAVALLKIAGAYWRGDEKNKMLQRIYGTAFASEKELAEHLERLKLAEERDHRKLGRELDLFVVSDLIGPGMPLYTARGAIVRREIMDYSRELQEAIGYQEVHTPNINKAELFKISGHYDKYKDDMLQVRSHYTDEEYFLKPMNCPQHTQLYASKLRSYKDLPIRIADFANLYRDEKPGELNGLARLRCFAQDDGHCFCREDQIEQEFLAVLNAIQAALKTYSMNYHVRLSLRDTIQKKMYIGDDAAWVKAENLLEKLLKKQKIDFAVAPGEAAFYGPKMDIMAQDAIGREWQISTIQLDFSMPARFKLTYVDADGSEKTPVMIHRAIVGSPERFMGILIEHYGGAFPTWLAPVQVALLPVSEKFTDQTHEIADQLRQAGIRTEVDISDESVGKKIRTAEKQKVPYMLVIGEKELASKKFAVRKRGSSDVEEINQEAFIARLTKEIAERK